jgi:hypothetical protein
MRNDEIKNMSLKKKKKQQINLGKSLKPELVSQIHNPLNPRHGVNQEAEFIIEG